MQTNHNDAMLLPAGLERYGTASSPELLLIICTDPILDARLVPRISSTPLLVWRSTGPVVPPYGPDCRGIEAVIDHALKRLDVKEIAVCGHLPSKPLKAILAGDGVSKSSPKGSLHHYVQSTRRLVQKKYGPLKEDQLHQAIVEENVFVQMANLRTYPSVLAAMASGRLRLHNWLFDANENQLYAHGVAKSRFLDELEEPMQPTQPPLPHLAPSEIYLA